MALLASAPLYHGFGGFSMHLIAFCITMAGLKRSYYEGVRFYSVSNLYASPKEIIV